MTDKHLEYLFGYQLGFKKGLLVGGLFGVGITTLIWSFFH